MLKILAALGLSILLSLPRPAAAEAHRLTPSSAWTIEHAKDNCTLARTFGEGEEMMTIFFNRYQPADRFRLTLIGNFARQRRSQPDVRIKFGPNEEAFVANVLSGEADGRPVIAFPGNMSIAGLIKRSEDADANNLNLTDPYEIDPEREQAVTQISLVSGLRQQFILETGSLGDPFAALRACSEELLHHWGIDVEKHRRLTRRATPTNDPRYWVTPGDIPGGSRHTGLVYVRLMIEPTGAVGDCLIQETTLPKKYEDATCDALLKRAQFDPALDSDGRPIKSFWANGIYWGS